MRKLSILLILSLLLCFTVQGSAYSKTAEVDALFTTEDLMDATVSELITAMLHGRLTAEGLVQMYIDRIEAYDEALGLNSIISLNPEAISEARKADEALASGTGAVIDCILNMDEMVSPMVAAGNHITNFLLK